uniref:Protein kinase domain-containing protein n=1 Tax=Leersia perrieri TaxID=77586 RepID=A0A0D9X8J2_9ORYZ
MTGDGAVGSGVGYGGTSGRQWWSYVDAEEVEEAPNGLCLLAVNGEEQQPPPADACLKKCGKVEIPYPFGIGSKCAMKGFALTCNRTRKGTYKPYAFNVEVLSISLNDGTARMRMSISSYCYNNSIGNMNMPDDWQLDFTDTPYRFSSTENKFTVVGCDTCVFINGDGITKNYTSGCVSMCQRPSDMTNGSCAGIGCCQTAIPEDLAYYNTGFSENYNTTAIWNFSRCSYAVLMEAKSFSFSSTYVTTSEFYDRNHKQVPIEETCRAAKRVASSYACRSSNSECIDSKNGPGYLCNCTRGFHGNPYLSGGCTDVDECAQDPNPCSATNGICRNTEGHFQCVCPQRMHLNNRGVCVQKQRLALWAILIIGISTGIFIIAIISFLYAIRERRKIANMKKSHFQQHGGFLLLEDMKSKQGITFKIFSAEEMEQATQNFDKGQILGHGGQGTVYKGILKDKRNVAIKRCKLINERQKKEFGKEMLILSQINHKNIVKLLGCCLEVEVPMLVYEFIQRGTLFQLIHGTTKGLRTYVPLGVRLKIVQEAAEALAYLHLSASPPILHGDVKSSNILLDVQYSAKVSDFGASTLAPVDKAQLVTLVQRTFGYLDPEYMQTCQLTDKSDVYSLGVVIVEVITGKNVCCLDSLEEDRTLSSMFISIMQQGKLETILDDQIKDGENVELLGEVAKLAMECLDMRSEHRPSMDEVAREIGRLTMSLQPQCMQPLNVPDEKDWLLGESSTTKTGTEMSSRNYSTMEMEAVASIAHGR